MHRLNNKKRALLKRAYSLLEQSSAIIDRVLDDEMDSLESIPENLQNTEQYETMENTTEKLEEVVDSLAEIQDCLTEIMTR